MKYNDKVLQNIKARKRPRYFGKPGIILLAISVGLVCLVVNALPCLSNPWKQWDNWRIVINTVLATIATVSFAGVAWEAIAKYTFSRDVVDLAGISENIRNSGVIAIETKFSDLNWKELLDGKQSFVAVISYSTKWAQNNEDLIKRISQIRIEQPQGKNGVVVVLPDPTNKELMASLKYRFTGVADLEKRILQAEAYFHSLGAEVEFQNKAITDSFYIIDNSLAIMATFTHQPASGGHTKTVPAIISRAPGFLFDYINEEVEAIRKTVTKVEPQDQQQAQE